MNQQVVEVDTSVLARVNAWIAREHALMLYRPMAVPVLQWQRDVLLVKSAKDDYWSLPQGRLNKGEGIIDGLNHELKEETNIEHYLTTVHRFCFANRLEMPGPGDGFLLGNCYFYFHMSCSLFPEVMLQESKVSDYVWISPEHARGFLSRKGRAYPELTNSMLAALQQACNR